MRVILKNFRVVDEETDIRGVVIVEDGIITGVHGEEPPSCAKAHGTGEAALVIDGSGLSSSDKLPVLMPAFVDLHAHFRDPGVPSESPLPSEVLESASLAAAAGGFGTVVCMANTAPAIDTLEKAKTLKSRCDSLGLVDLYPVLSLSKRLEGKELSEIVGLFPESASYIPLMLSEDGRDLADDGLFLAAMKEARRLGIPVSCHCDLGGDEAGAVRRVIDLGKRAGCRIHIAHVSTREAVEAIARTKKEVQAVEGGFALTCEATPHHLCLVKDDAVKLGEKTWGRVNPQLRPEEDRQALIRAIVDGTLDAIATDHAPHSRADKEAGAPGFSGLETAFAAVFTELSHPVIEPKVGAGRGGHIDLKSLSSLMSARPAGFLGFGDSQKRGRMLPGHRADLVVVDTEASWVVAPGAFKSRGKNSPLAGRKLNGKILLTLQKGKVVFSAVP
uniref:Dihydroorotase n=1 Tax=uncultured bacterium contig00101 TaxID=1181568 RepID=A0A806JZ69_9BACT|nr:dihydroorotase [uncultured bacterium contig00101]